MATKDQQVAQLINLPLQSTWQSDRKCKIRFYNGAAFIYGNYEWKNVITNGKLPLKKFRNGATFAIYNRYTGDYSYIPEKRLEVLIGIAVFGIKEQLFCAQKQYVILVLLVQMNMKTMSTIILHQLYCKMVFRIYLQSNSKSIPRISLIINDYWKSKDYRYRTQSWKKSDAMFSLFRRI
jgi:hypothetical protein